MRAPAAGRDPDRPAATFLWRRLDGRGLDSCRLLRTRDGWTLRGGAVLQEGRRPCHVAYEVACDAEWRTRGAHVVGHVGARTFDARITRDRGAWRLNGEPGPATRECIDVDLAFTPATNLIAIRRLGLAVGERAEAKAAWLEFPALRLRELPQTYHRIARGRYAYEAPTTGYSGTLEVAPSGAVVRYPGLFTAESPMRAPAPPASRGRGGRPRGRARRPSGRRTRGGRAP